ncbi:hypothetical protein [Salinilacihabitans rarus]|uniref:hypothetical protein n=1 Tax=Salinilacihabitans rarus TaxID=2961596 RepID=UPI0020C88C35|nr:hypothetical protein [Salinilacihabitans rarus]
MDRRGYLTGVTIGIVGIAGCSDSLGNANSDTRNAGTENTGADTPEFEVDDDAPGTVILLRQQPQNPNGVVVGDEFEIAIVLGNAGGEPVSTDVSVELGPPTDDEPAQMATVAVDELPAGAARFFTAGPFAATVAGDWELTAGPEIDRVYPEYDGIVTVEDQADE